MQLRRVLPVAGLVVVLLTQTSARAHSSFADLPDRLSDKAFWELAESLSEPDGTFRSDNVLSNEMVFARMVPDVVRMVRPGGVYLGVGPEQNFTYIHTMRARMAFITDIRRENLHLHLMYKALFELSADRAEFLSRLFSKPRPAGLSKTTSIVDLTNAYWNVASVDEAGYAANLRAITSHLTRIRSIPLPQADVDGVARIYRAFYWYGPQMNYSASLDLTPLGGGRAATYFDLMTQTGRDGVPLTYLGSEEAFAYLKDLQSRNLIVPVVGNFGGPKAIRAIGAWVRERGATVDAFYVSSVEPYLKRAGTFETFCASVATLPVDERSMFIRPGNLANLSLSAPAVAPPDATSPRIGTYQIGVVVPIVGGCR